MNAERVFVAVDLKVANKKCLYHKEKRERERGETKKSVCEPFGTALLRPPSALVPLLLESKPVSRSSRLPSPPLPPELLLDHFHPTTDGSSPIPFFRRYLPS